MNTNYNTLHEFEFIINDDEQIIWTGKPKSIPFLLKATPILLVGVIWYLVVGIMMPFSSDEFVMGFGSEGTDPFFLMLTLIRVLPFLFGIGQVIYYLFVLKNTHYAITSKRLLFKSGIFGIDYKIIDYDQIKNMEVNVNPIEKLFHVGTIHIFNGEIITTNQRSRALPSSFSAIADPYEVFKQLKKISMDIKTDWNYPNQYRPTENEGYATKYKQ